MASFRDKLIGAWELIEYSAHLPDDPSNKKYPMGPEAKGIIMYTPDGYMSAQLLTPGQPKFSQTGGSDSEWAQVGKNYVAYTGEFFLDEEGDGDGPILLHHMRTSSWPALVGDTQRRLCKIVDEEGGRFLYLSLKETSKVFGEDRLIVVKWRRFPENKATKPPAKI